MTPVVSPAHVDAKGLAALAVDASNRHDIEALAALLAVDVAFDNPVTGPTDRDGMLGFHRGLFAGFPDIHYQVIELTTAGDRTIAECMVSGTHLGTYAGAPASGRRLSVAAAFSIVVRDGEIVDWRSYFDRVPVLRVLGRIE